MLVLEGLVGLYRTVELQLLWLGNRLYLLLDFSLGFPGSSTCKESACNAGDPGLIPGLGRFPGEGIRYRLQYSCLFQFQLFVIALVYIFYFFLVQSWRVVSKNLSISSSLSVLLA